MSCEACVRHVTRALDGMSGVLNVRVDLESATALLTVEPERVDVEDLIRALSQEGYAARAADTPNDNPPAPDPYSRAGGCCRSRRGPTAAD